MKTIATYEMDRARYDARMSDHDREATRQQAIAAASRCFFAAWWLSLRGDVEGAERFLRHIPELVKVIFPSSSLPERSPSP